MRKFSAQFFIMIFIGAMISFAVIADENHKIIVGDDQYYPPYSFIDANGEPAGFNVELVKALGEAIGYDVEVHLYEWSEAREALEKGEIDVISGMVYSKEREEKYSFSLKHTVSSGDIFTRGDISLNSLEELKGKTIVVQKSDIVAEYLSGLDLDLRFIEMSSAKDGIKAVADGSYDYAALTKLPGLYAIVENNISNVYPQNMHLISNDYGMAVLKGNENLLLELNNGLQALKASGKYQEIYDRWISIYEEVTVNEFISRFKWVPFSIFFVFIVLLGFISTSKVLVNQKTRELREANQNLWAKAQEIRINMEELTAIEEELRSQNDQLMENDKELRESESKIRAIVEALPDLVFVFSKDGRIVDAHVGDDNELYLPRKEFFGKKIEDLMPEDIVKKFRGIFEKVFSEGGVHQFEYELLMNGQREIYEVRLNQATEDKALGIVRNISSEKKYRERVEYLSYHDRLTGLYNRHYFEEKMTEIDTIENLPICLIMADVNGLKLINDSFGHSMGDQLLIKVGEVLKAACGSDELIFRIGGDEFVILLKQMQNGQPDELISRIKDLAAKENINSIDLSISFGWMAKNLENEQMQDIFNSAENLMYKRKLFESPSMRGKTINAIINTLYEKNRREEQHSRRVSELASELANVIGMSEQEVEEIRSMGLLHDIGKIAINETILNKEGKLTQEEYGEIKAHSEIGYRILSSANDMSDMAEYVLYHHEKWNGEGYPKGLKGEEIPLQSRIIGVVDAYDAMTSQRTYRDSKSMDEAIEELKIYSGTQFDPELVEIFITKVLKKQI